MTILVELPTHLEAAVEQAAAKAGLSVQQYVVQVLTAAQQMPGPRGERIERATAAARSAHARWTAGGCDETGAMTMDEVFG